MNVKIIHGTISTSKPSNTDIEKLQSIFSQITLSIILDHESPITFD